jgi:hypothetical protein
MQKLTRIRLTVEAYVLEQFHTRMRPPEQCPNCGGLHRLWAHGYYRRYSTEAAGRPIAFLVRRFLCVSCEVTVSCLPYFAQPYRLINHATVQGFLEGRWQRRDVAAQQGLLQRYARRFAAWLPKLSKIVGARWGRASPQEEATAFLRRAVAACGSAAELTMELVTGFRTTCFRNYRCHQPTAAR